MLISIVSLSYAQGNVIIPQPLKMVMSEGNAGFSINKNTSIITDNEFLSEAKILATYLKKVTGFAITVKQKADKPSSEVLILLKRDKTLGMPEEGYVMDVSNMEIQIQASHPAGAYYGCISLIQAIEFNENSQGFTITSMHIEDQSRFPWRGLMLDCSRTFVSVDYLKKTIERMSFYKLNKLHLHLTDDQGWRLEIKKWPLLTSKGASFAPKLQ